MQLSDRFSLMSAGKPKPSSSQQKREKSARTITAPTQAPSAKTRTYGLPGTTAERSARLRRLKEEHRETLRRLGEIDICISPVPADKAVTTMAAGSRNTRSRVVGPFGHRVHPAGKDVCETRSTPATRSASTTTDIKASAIYSF